MDVLTIRPDGVVKGLFTEIIALSEIGTLAITRASTIEFNSASQQWEVRDLRGQVSFTSPSRQTCLHWEHQHFNELMLHSAPQPQIPNHKPMN